MARRKPDWNWCKCRKKIAT